MRIVHSVGGPVIGLVLAAAVVGFAAPIAQAGLVGVASVDTNNSALWDISTSTGAATNLRTVNATPNRPPDAIAYAPSGTLYGVSAGEPTDGPSSGHLFTVSLTTGTPLLVATLSTFIHIEGDIAVDPTTGDLYAIDGSGGPLFRINTTSGLCATVGNVGPNLDLSAMTFDSAGNLYMVNSFASTLLKVNKTNAAVISTTPLVPAVNASIGGLAFDTGDANLYFAGGQNSVLYRLNPNTGATIAVGPIAVSGGIYGLVFVPDVTPTTPRSWGSVKALYR